MADAQPPLEYATPGVQDPEPLRPRAAGFFVAAVVLTIPSLLVVYVGASDEPYYGTIRKSDAFVQVGFGSVLIAAWLAWGAWLAASVSRGRTHSAALALLFWPALAVFYLAHSVDGYVDDLITYQRMTAPPPAAPAAAAAAPPQTAPAAGP